MVRNGSINRYCVHSDQTPKPCSGQVSGCLRKYSEILHLQSGELASPTNDINLTAALAIIVLVYYVGAGIIAKKGKFLLHEVSFVGIVMMLVELLEMVTRPLSLAIRLFANVFAGEILVTLVLGACAYLAPLPVMFFEILVAFIQATVFMMLTIAYISSATSESH